MRLMNRLRLAVGLPFKPEDHGGGLTLMHPGPRTRAEREAWEIKKNALYAEAINNHDQSQGTCLACDLPIRLHPPGRVLSSNPAFCEQARQRASTP